MDCEVLAAAAERMKEFCNCNESSVSRKSLLAKYPEIKTKIEVKQQTQAKVRTCSAGSFSLLLSKCGALLL